MTVSYTKEQRSIAKEKGRHLCTIEVPGISFQGPLDEEEKRMISKFMVRFFKVHSAKLKAKRDKA